jgi:hypothetical protein
MIPYFCACQGFWALRLARATVSLLVNANRKHRHVIDARRPIQYGGGACNLLLRTVTVTSSCSSTPRLKRGRS